ncbi:MAG: diacylglycerol kinase family protein [Candidatus Buchananbacteria bacterium]
MYLYLYDHFLNGKSYANQLARIETRLTDLGIGGKIFRLSPLRNLVQLVNDEIKNGIHTVVAVGNDKTVAQIINAIATHEATLGIIPIGSDQKIANALGIGSAHEACNILASRIIEKMDLGKANDTYFISNLKVSSGRLVIECENQFQIIPQAKNEISICNLKPSFAGNTLGKSYFNPQDGSLELFIQPQAARTFGFFKKAGSLQDSIIPFKRLEIKSKDSVTVTTDGQRVLKPPVQIEIAAKKLKVIVGKDRVF